MMADTQAIGVAYRDQSISGGTIDNTPIGATTASTVAATSLTATSAAISGGATIGDAAADLISFHGAAAVDQAAVITQVGTSVPVAVCGAYGLTTTQLTAIITGLNAVIVALQEKGLTAAA